MDEFERQLKSCYGPLERFVRFRMSGHEDDADDVLQEVLLTAYQRFHTLRDITKFKPWLISIAQNKCRDYYRKQRPRSEVPLESVVPYLTLGRCGPAEVVRATLDDLPEQDRALLHMTYYAGLTQAEIAKQLNIPLGTVKSRLFAAKRRFRQSYPYPPHEKGESLMKYMPEIMPSYTITPSEKPPFPVIWEEVMGWFIVPKPGEKLQWAMYDFPAKKRTMHAELEVTGKAQVHGIRGVEIRSLEYDPVPSEQLDAQNPVERVFVAQLTDTHCRLLSQQHTHNGVKELYTFLDGDEFLDNWGFGPDNCGNETHLAPKGLIHKDGPIVTVADTPWPLDIVGRYTVTIGGKSYDTVCVMDVSCYNGGVVTETYLDEHGRTILWRRFNRNDWAMDHFKKPWTEQLPDNERLTVNGATHVHWYDCITDYIL